MDDCSPFPFRLRHPIRFASRYEHVRPKRFDFAVYFAFTVNMEFIGEMDCAICAVLETFRAVFSDAHGGEYIVFVVTADAGNQ